MADTIPTISKDDGVAKKDGGQSLSVSKQQLLTVIRIQLAEKKKLEAPVLAASRLAKYCQHLRDENERLKLRAQNYEMGMVRAERRSAQLQNDLYKAQKSGYSADKTAAHIPFYLPSSVQQLIDSLTAQNVVLMKGLNKATEHPKGAAVMEKNLQMQEKIKVLEEEIALKTSIINQYEVSMNKSESTNNDEESDGIMEQKKECMQLKMKLRTYQNYIRHLRERNTAIMHSIMEDFDKKNKAPSESMDDGIADLYDDGLASASSNAGSGSGSREGSRNQSRVTSRRESLKDSNIQTDLYCQNAESQTESDVSCLDSLDLHYRLDLHEECSKQIEDLMDVIKQNSSTIRDQEVKENLLKERLSALEDSYRTFAEESELRQRKVDDIVRELNEAKSDKVKLETELKEAEQIVNMMQEHVDNVNKGNTDVSRLKRELEKCQNELAELPMMQQVLKNYEEEIKSYGPERHQLLQTQENLKKENEQLQGQLKELSSRASHATIRAQIENSQQELQRQQMRQQRMQMQRKMLESPKEPWQNNDWFREENRPGDIVVHDGASRSISMSRADGDGINKPRQGYERSRSTTQTPTLPRAYAGQDISPGQAMSQEQIDEQNEYRDYVEHGTVKCTNCGERFPSTLFQDHFRDCAR